MSNPISTSTPTEVTLPLPLPSTSNPNHPSDTLSKNPDIQENGLHKLVNLQTAKDIWTFLLVFRVFNSFLVKTFFQPDEYFQSLEPAWQMAFGSDSGAWLTWEWHYQLRSSLHPALFAAAYYLVDKPMALLNFFPQFRAEILAVLPNIIQAIFAAACDYYTWKMAEKMYGLGSRTGYVTLLMSVLSPWNWFCSTRTFSNSLETSLTITALYYWPWDMAIDSGEGIKEQSKGGSSITAPEGVFRTGKSVNHLRYALLLAGIACILRPTNLLIWFCVIMPTIISLIPGVNSQETSKSPISRDYIVFIREAVLCGSFILLISAFSDRLYFGEWTFPPYQWLHFNISQNLAVIYGQNDWHYFLSQGLPLLLFTYLPFTILSIFKTYTPSTITKQTFTSNIQIILTHLTAVMIFILSTISHKEVRFIYPLLPILLILTAPSITSFFTSEIQTPPSASSSTSATSASSNLEPKTTRKPLLILLILLNIALAAYTTLIHQSAVISVTTFIRHRYESEMLDAQGIPLYSPEAYSYLKHYPANENPPPSLTIDYDIKKEENSQYAARAMGTSQNPNWEKDMEQPFVGFLMPCHSTGWRSRLVYKGLGAWALGCEPPVHLSEDERGAYRDEADRFYDDPRRFLSEEMIVFEEWDDEGKEGGGNGGEEGRDNKSKKQWPRYLVGFEGIETDIREFYEGGLAEEGIGAGRGKKMKEIWRERNTQWIDDWRRSGDVVVWEFI
ncbi:glycosyltransferase family 22 protein [Sclerotinia borealis F-4128]|uniref:Mannosyltransferase n=1 Tax=Sclerotinia borealis (strain F-4128) TaxID=1432307 RepID=W9C603_SCLBF|nr:glycosyltransferase family 22 protein [Sclerotinia borealis F-4128]